MIKFATKNHKQFFVSFVPVVWGLDRSGPRLTGSRGRLRKSVRRSLSLRHEWDKDPDCKNGGFRNWGPGVLNFFKGILVFGVFFFARESYHLGSILGTPCFRKPPYVFQVEAIWASHRTS